MHKRFTHGMTLNKAFGKPTFFLTMTTNTEWPEIKNELRPGEKAYDRPDLCCRVFKEKLKAVINDIGNGIFGEHNVRCGTIEFQKRGAPHAHILVWIENFEAISHEIDNVISAEIPDPDSPLHDKVLKVMVHGPCRSLNLEAKCMKNSRCKKHFQKPYMDNTVLVDGDYPRC